MTAIRRRQALRRTTRIGTQSDTERGRQGAWRKVKEQVFVRAMLRCETELTLDEVGELRRRGASEGGRFAVTSPGLYRCVLNPQDGAHVRKPRNQHHHVECVLALCRRCHNWMDFGVPSDKRGRLMAEPTVACRSDHPETAGGCPPEVHPQGEVAPRTYVTRQTKWERRAAN